MKNFSNITENLDITTKEYVDDGLNEKANIAGQAFTGGISAPNISTGSAAANYFQSQKFRGEGDANTYYHAIDYGYAGHNQVDFHEYGGLYNFYKNTNGTSTGGSLVGAITPDGIKEGSTLLKDKYAQIADLATVATSGSYNDLSDKPTIPSATEVVQATGTSTTAVMSQNAVTNGLNGKLSKTDNTGISVLGTTKSTTTLGGNQLYAPRGIIFGGSAAAAGLVTRGICGITGPSTGGACTKDNLYLNYDGNNNFNASRQVVINAGSTGTHLGSNMYQYTAPRGEIVKNWVEAKGYATSVKMNGNTVASSGGVVDIGNVLTSVPSNMVTTDTEQEITGLKSFNRIDAKDIGLYNSGDNSSFSASDGGDTSYFSVNSIKNSDGSYSNSIEIGIDANCELALGVNGNAGTSGQVLTSQGAGNTPIWADVSGGSGDNSKHGYTQLTNENLNTITEVGWYRAASGNTCTNRPSGIGAAVPFVLEVEKSINAYIKQTAYRTGSAIETYYATYTRYSLNAGISWVAWVKQQTLADGYNQTFSGLKTFATGINLTSSLQVSGSSGTSGQVLTSTGTGTPQWKTPGDGDNGMPTIQLVSIKDTTGTGICGVNNPLRFTFKVTNGTLLDTDYVELCSRTLFTYGSGHRLTLHTEELDYGRTYKLKAFHSVLASQLFKTGYFYIFEIGSDDNNYKLREFVRSNMPNPSARSPYTIIKYLRITRTGMGNNIHSNVIPIYVAPTSPNHDTSTGNWSAKIRIR